MAKLLATDLDGTLFYPGQIKTCIPKKNIKFLQRWIDGGNRLIVVTSRSHEFVDKLKDEIKRPFDVVACSSAEIFADGKLLRDVAMPNKTLSEILKIINDDLKPLSYMMTTKGYPCIINANREIGNFFLFFYRIWKFFQFKREEPFIVSNEKFLDQLNNGRVYKIIIFFGLGHGKNKFTKELNKQFRSKYPMLEFSWTTKVIEITPYGCNKGMGLKYYTEAMGFKKEDVYVVGDSGNDISMFTEFYENSYCMRHAYTSVRKYAKHTVSRVYKLEKMLLKGDNKNEQN